MSYGRYVLRCQCELFLFSFFEKVILCVELQTGHGCSDRLCKRISSTMELSFFSPVINWGDEHVLSV